MQKSKTYISKWLTRKRILLTGLFVSVVLLGLTMFWFYYQNRILEKEYKEQSMAALEENKYEDLFQNIQKTSLAVRAFVATRNENFVADFSSLIDSIESNYSDLKILQDRSNSSLDPKLYEEFDRLFTEKIRFVQLLEQLCKANNCDSAIALLGTEKGNRLSNSLIAMKDKTSTSFRISQNSSKAIYTSLNNKNNSLAYLGFIAAMLFIAVAVYFLFREIKQANEMSEELLRQKEFMRVTLRSLGEGLITTGKDGHIIYMNPAAEKLTGWKNHEAINKPLHTVYSILNEETGLPFENIVSRIIRQGKTVELENNTILRSKDDEYFVISNNGSPLLDLNGNVLGAVLVFNDITEKKKIEDNLKVSEMLFRNMIENISEVVYTCDELGYILVYNKAAAKLWGREPVIGKEKWAGSWKILSTNGVELSVEYSPMAVSIKEKRPVLGTEVIIQREDGSTRHVLPSPTPLFNAAGKLIGAVNMLFDITDKNEREILIRKTEEKYKNLFDQASDAIVTYTFDGVIHEFNDIICDISGYTKDEFARLKISDILIGDLIMSNEKYEGILAGQSVTLYRQFKRKDGGLVDMEIKTKLLPDGKVLGIGRDITERKRNEEIIREANERYEILAMATSDTIWDWDMLNNKMLYNEGNKLMFGYENTQIEDVNKWWKENIYPSDFNRVINYLEGVYSHKQNLIQLDYRFRCADGTYKYILDRGFVIYNEEGKAIRMIGAMQDITKEKEHEKQIAIAIIDTQEKERQELGMELHDNVNQLLSATLLYLGMANKSSRQGNEVSETLDECVSYVGEAINEIRNLSHRLTPDTGEDASLKDILRWLTDPIQKANEFEINLQVDDIPPGAVSNDLRTNLYRIAQAQITNIMKHAQAGKVYIDVQFKPGYISLTITDDGVGFDHELIKDGIGLQNIKRRAEIFSGIYSIKTSPGNGCCLKVEIPLG
jgi:two-component system sensor histidine kinase UhpB